MNSFHLPPESFQLPGALADKFQRGMREALGRRVYTLEDLQAAEAVCVRVGNWVRTVGYSALQDDPYGVGLSIGREFLAATVQRDGEGLKRAAERDAFTPSQSRIDADPYAHSLAQAENALQAARVRYDAAGEDLDRCSNMVARVKRMAHAHRCHVAAVLGDDEC